MRILADIFVSLTSLFHASRIFATNQMKNCDILDRCVATSVLLKVKGCRSPAL